MASVQWKGLVLEKIVNLGPRLPRPNRPHCLGYTGRIPQLSPLFWLLTLKANVKLGSRKDSLSTLIAAREDDGTGLSHDELVGMASIFLVAGPIRLNPFPVVNSTWLTVGVDTTAITLVYISYLLAKHPEWFDRLASELVAYTDVDSLQSSELEKLPLLNAIIRETLRLYPPAASPVFSRVVPEGGSHLGGYDIPTGVHPCRSTLGLTIGQSESCSMECLS